MNISLELNTVCSARFSGDLKLESVFAFLWSWDLSVYNIGEIAT